MSVKLLIADDQEIVRAGLRDMLAETDIEIVAVATTGTEALRMAERFRPDLCLMEVRLPEMDGLQVLGRIKLDMPELHVLIFSAYDSPRYVARAVALGAEGYLTKECPREELLQGIRAAARGEQIWTGSELRRVGTAMATPATSEHVEVALTRRELEVLREMVTGATNRDIAKNLQISYETVKEHVQHVLRKVGVTDRTQAAVWAVRRGLV
jgi:DNA-binding NarL/FixJ family response regulator